MQPQGAVVGHLVALFQLVLSRPSGAAARFTGLQVTKLVSRQWLRPDAAGTGARIGGAMGSAIPDDEWQIRCDLAACYRLVDMFGWSDLINTRITARVPGAHDHFLINPYGLLF